MKPNFALTMSFEGIGLLHRTERGWHLVDNVSLANPHLGSALTVLRSKALALAPNGMGSKLVIPNDQIRYIKFNATELDSNNLADELCKYLEDVTPYKTDQLVFDWAHDNGEIYVAAVARQTLEEAEAFAAEHRFAPLCFVAIPEKDDFVGEPWFGETASANATLQNDATVERDNDVIKIIGSQNMPEPEQHFESDVLPTPVETMYPRSSEYPDEPTVSEHYDQSDSPNQSKAHSQSDEMTPPELEDSSQDAQAFYSEDPKSSIEKTNSTLIVDTTPRLPTPKSETQRMTVFGARKPEKKRKLLYIADVSFAFLIAILIIALIIIMFFIKESNLIQLSERVFDKNNHALAASNNRKLEVVKGIDPEVGVDGTAADTILADRNDRIISSTKYNHNSKNKAVRHYARTGIWHLPHNSTIMPYSPNLDELHQDTSDTEVITQNSFALNGEPVYYGDPYIRAEPSDIQAAFYLSSNRDIPDNIISAETVDGYKIVLAAANYSKNEITDNNGSQHLASSLKLRPAYLAEQRNGIDKVESSRNKIAAIRPKIRPDNAQELAIERIQNSSATEQAVAISRRPKPRPKDFHRIVRSNRIASIIPSAKIVQKHATQKKAIKLSKKNVIGIYGTSSKRTALIRTPNGKLQMLKVGDSFDGGYVAAIGNTEIHYVKNGIFLILKIPTS